MRFDRSTLLLGLASASLLTYAFNGNKDLLAVVQAGGGVCAIAATVSLQRRTAIEDADPHNTALLEALADAQEAHGYRVEDVVQRYERQVYDLQEQLQRANHHKDTALQEAWLELHAERETHAERFEKLEFEFERLQQEEELAIAAFREQRDALEARQLKAEETLASQASELEAHLEERWQARTEAHAAELEIREKFIADLQAKLREANALQMPALDQGAAGVAARIAIEVLAERGILCDCDGCFSHPTKEIYVWLKPRQMADGKPLNIKLIKDRLEDIELAVGLGQPELTLDGTRLQLMFPPLPEQLPAAMREAVNRKPVIIEQPRDYLRTYIQRTDRLSAILLGDSGSGKSTLVNNYICLIKQELAGPHGEPVNIIIIDGKDPDSPWEIDGRTLIPQYGGINDPEEDELNWVENDCLTGLQTMKEDVYARLYAKRAARDRGAPMPAFVKTIYVVDEAEEIVDVHGKQASRPILTAARLGRSSGVAVVVIGQNANPSAYGFQIPNLKNFTRFYLRDNAPKGIYDAIPIALQRKPLLEQLALREHRAKGLDPNDPHRYWAFVKISGEPGFVATLPPPHAYSVSATFDVPATVLPPDTAEAIPPMDELIAEAEATLPIDEGQRAKLEQYWNLSTNQKINQLPDHLKLLAEFARAKQGAVSASDARSNRSWLRKHATVGQIVDWYKELAALGIGEWIEELQKYAYSDPV